MDNVEMAQDSLEHAHGHGDAHGTGHGGVATPRSTRLAAVLVAVIAAVAVIVEMGGNDQQTAYLAHDVAASDLWSQYQGKSVRHTVLQQTALLLDAQAASAGAAGQEAVRRQDEAAAAEARAGAARLEDDTAHDGLHQLTFRAHAEEQAREHALHLHEGLERSVRGMQIAIVLVGLFMATRLFWLLGLGSTLAGLALLYGIVVSLGLS